MYHGASGNLSAGSLRPLSRTATAAWSLFLQLLEEKVEQRRLLPRHQRTFQELSLAKDAGSHRKPVASSEALDISIPRYLCPKLRNPGSPDSDPIYSIHNATPQQNQGPLAQWLVAWQLTAYC